MSMSPANADSSESSNRAWTKITGGVVDVPAAIAVTRVPGVMVMDEAKRVTSRSVAHRSGSSTIIGSA